MARGVALLMLALAVPAEAGEMLVHGKVVNVVPITEQRTVTEERGECDPARPAAGAGLADLLAWDLRVGCRHVAVEQPVITGYRVTYEWDRRLYHTVMAEPPHGTVPLRVTIR